MVNGNCTTCDRPGRVRKGLCDAHYFRLRRTGSVGQAEVATKNPGLCSINGCRANKKSNGLCHKHDTRYRRHGDPSVVMKVGTKPGAANANWHGDSVSYSGLHQRLTRARGRAATHTCSCGQQAQEWAYDRTDPSPLTSSYGDYSPDVSKYIAMCVRCHRLWDNNPIAVQVKIS